MFCGTQVCFYFEIDEVCVCCRQVEYDYGDRTVESKLVIQDFQSDDLHREFNCSVKNERGFDTRRAQLKEEGEEESLATLTGSP